MIMIPSVSIGTATLHNACSLEAMRLMPDKAYSLAVVDVPYGIGEDGQSNHLRSCLAETTKFMPKAWDKEPPTPEYFNELFRVSKNQIVWGANHFISRLPYDSACWIVWDKMNGATDFADCELAYTSFKTAVRKFSFQWQGMLQGDMKNKETRLHPCQKPVRLYSWLLQNYAKAGDTILDTHGGSMSSVIAALDMGYKIDCYEIDEDYFKAAVERVERSQQQRKLFTQPKIQKQWQQGQLS